MFLFFIAARARARFWRCDGISSLGVHRVHRGKAAGLRLLKRSRLAAACTRSPSNVRLNFLTTLGGLLFYPRTLTSFSPLSNHRSTQLQRKARHDEVLEGECVRSGPCDWDDHTVGGYTAPIFDLRRRLSEPDKSSGPWSIKTMSHPNTTQALTGPATHTPEARLHEEEARPGGGAPDPYAGQRQARGRDAGRQRKSVSQIKTGAGGFHKSHPNL